MGLQVACSKGCGHIIEVTDEVLDEAKRLGAPINVSHEVCPTDERAPMRTFKIRVIVSELHGVPSDEAGAERGEESLASMGAMVDAGSFQLALPGLQAALNEQWDRVLGMAQTVDGGRTEGVQTTE